MDTSNQRHGPNGKYVKTHGQVDIVREVFEAGGSLTVAEALQGFGIYALSQRVGDLERTGYPVDREMVTLPSGKRVARYSKLRITYG